MTDRPASRLSLPRARRAVCALVAALAVLGPAQAGQQAERPDNTVTVRSIQLAQAEARRHNSGAPEPIAVVFPDIGEPYRKIFTEIIDGIDEGSKAGVRAYPVSSNQDLGELAAAMKRNGTRVVIALGRQGLKAAASVEAPAGTLISGVSYTPDSDKQIGIMLAPDPALLFSHLRSLAPGVKRVHVVYNAANNEWLIRLAKEAARAQGIELVTYEAHDLATAAHQYETVFAVADPRRDAMWLLPDTSTVDESTILPLVLRESWNRNLAVFSNSQQHVRRGVLFSLYPNNQDLGRSLAGLANSMLSGETLRKGVSALRDVHSALNMRTASHIGLSISPKIQRNFDAVFAEP